MNSMLQCCISVQLHVLFQTCKTNTDFLESENHLRLNPYHATANEKKKLNKLSKHTFVFTKQRKAFLTWKIEIHFLLRNCIYISIFFRFVYTHPRDYFRSWKLQKRSTFALPLVCARTTKFFCQRLSSHLQRVRTYVLVVFWR